MSTLLKRKLATAAAVGLLIVTSSAARTDEISFPKPSLAAQTFKNADTGEEKPFDTFMWRRPPEVSFVIISGCGGGGGGGAAQYQAGKIRAGEGGNNSQHSSQLVGPLSSLTYEIHVGRGGVGGADGNATEFIGTEVRISFAGGSFPRVDKVPWEGSPGLPSVFGSGGNAGGKNMPGTSAESMCAGGGGAGTPTTNPAVLRGGDGGGGTLTIYPLPDLAKLIDQVNQIDRQTE